jgi:uncharacterized membrane protein
MKMTIHNFLTRDGLASISTAVTRAERNTSGEIRVLVVQKSRPHLSLRRFGSSLRGSLKTVRRAVKDRAMQEFVELGVGKTRGHTGVLIMISLDERMVVVCGDKPINDKVHEDSWGGAVSLITGGIRSNSPADGIIRAVERVGMLLAAHFPIQPGDVNELPNNVVLKE